jgi:hypothetical protein
MSALPTITSTALQSLVSKKPTNYELYKQRRFEKLLLRMAKKTAANKLLDGLK